jgi:uncharacterized protein DUF4192
MDAQPYAAPAGPPSPAGGRYDVRISDPGEVAAALPHLLGFRPRESVVLLALGGTSGSRVGVTVRADIPSPAGRPEVARDLVRRVVTSNPNAVLVAVVSEAVDPGGPETDLPHRELVREVTMALGERGLGARLVLLVRGGRWWSYDCPQPCCTPGAGTRLPDGVTELEAASVLAGQVIADDRAELSARIEPDLGRSVAMCEALERVAHGFADAVRARGRDEVAVESWHAVLAAVGRIRSRSAAPLSDDEVARLLWGLHDRSVRDRALRLALGPDAAAVEQLWTECTRRGASPLTAAPATLLAVSAWLRGDGAMAGIALERALADDPTYRFAHLLVQGLAGCLPPDEIRALIVDTLDELEAPSGVA